MKEIRLTKGKVAIVDDHNYEWLSKWKWCAEKGHNTYYAARGIRLPNGQVRQISMHRLILGLSYKDGKHTDHISHNGLDNQEENIRICTNAENQHNQRHQKRKTSSQYKGVSWKEKGKKWQAHIRINGKQKYLGIFKNERVAALIYDLNARKLFGRFALPNFS